MLFLEPFGSQFPKDLFEHFATKYLTITDLGRIAQCSKSLNSRVNNLSSSFWINQISLAPLKYTHLDPEITIRWLEKEQNHQLSRLCYIAYKFLFRTTQKYSNLLDVDQQSFGKLPSPILCSWLHHSTGGMDFSCDELYEIWKLIPECDRENFYTFIVEDVIVCVSSLPTMGTRNMHVYAEFIERGLCDLIKKSIPREAKIANLLEGMRQINAHGAIKKLLALAKTLLQQDEHNEYNYMLKYCVNKYDSNYFF